MKVTKNNELSIIDEYKKGLSMKLVGEKFGISSATVLRILRNNNIDTRTNGGIYKLPNKSIVDLYESGLSSTEISKIYNVSIHTVTTLLDKNGIERNNRYKNKGIIRNYFSYIDSYDKAYFIGLLLTDGNVGKKSNAISLELNSTDKDILEVFREKTNNSNKLYSTRGRNTLKFCVKCKEWKKDLAKFGIVPCKTFTIDMPILEEIYMPHLIRGMFDGDGWISKSKSKNLTFNQIGFCGNEVCVTHLRNYLCNTLNVFKPKVLHTEENLYQVSWSSKGDIIIICKYLYKDKNDCFLKRKYDKFLSIYGNTEITN